MLKVIMVMTAAAVAGVFVQLDTGKNESRHEKVTATCLPHMSTVPWNGFNKKVIEQGI